VIVGPGVTVTGVDASEIQPVEVCVNVKVAVPGDTAVIKPVFVIVATALLELLQVPPVVGEILVVAPTHIELGPFNTVIGLGLTVITPVGRETQPALLVKVNVTIPSATPVTTPLLVTVAIAGLELVQVPPVDGDSCVVPPIHTLSGPVILTVGLGIMAILTIGSEAQPAGEV
jgi:hypothetical protein